MYVGFPGNSMIENLPASAGDGVWSLGGEKGMATRSSILAHEISQTEKPEGYSPWGPKRVGHDSATKQQQSMLVYDSCV